MTFYRILPTYVPSRSDWIHVTLLSLCALGVACSSREFGGKPHTYAPNVLWKHTMQLVTGRINKGGDALREAEVVLTGVIAWAEVLVGLKEEKEGW